MKKFLSIAILAAALLANTNTAFAANNVSRMAVNNGGQQVAACARMMDRGVSECARAKECNMN